MLKAMHDAGVLYSSPVTPSVSTKRRNTVPRRRFNAEDSSVEIVGSPFGLEVFERIACSRMEQFADYSGKSHSARAVSCHNVRPMPSFNRTWTK